MEAGRELRRRHARPRPSTPTTTVAPTTAINIPGEVLLPLSSRITASVPAPTRAAVQFTPPLKISLPMDHRLCAAGRALSIEKPNSLGSWLTKTVKAMPFM